MAVEQSVAWEIAPPEEHTETSGEIKETRFEESEAQALDESTAPGSMENWDPVEEGSNAEEDRRIVVQDAQRENRDTKDMYVSYAVKTSKATVRRRFSDFTFLRQQLLRMYPTCAVPPLPGKHRLEYITGDRFGDAFIERRRVDLERFLNRIQVHPRLSVARVFAQFLQSDAWAVDMHELALAPRDGDAPSSVIESLSDTLLNAFTKMRHPDPVFVDMRTHVEHMEANLASMESELNKFKGLTADIALDYEDLATSFQGLGFLESGIAQTLIRFEQGLFDYVQALKDSCSFSAELVFAHLHSIVAYLASFKHVLHVRDQKQLDTEELNSYLKSLVLDRERIVSGSSHSAGITSFIREKVELYRAGESELSRHARIQRLDAKVKELQEAIVVASRTSHAFNAQVIKEYDLFERLFYAEIKSFLSSYIDLQITVSQKSVDCWDRTIARISMSVHSGQ